RAIAGVLRPGRLVVLESTTWPGTTREVLRPLLEAGGLRCGEGLFLAYSPEREDPGNPRFRTAGIPKLVAGADPASLRLALALYGAVVERTVAVGSLEAAETAKLAENVFRAVNIALADELKRACHGLGVDVWEVIGAAATKPFGYMPFWPGPGPGGHCIPVDPLYLRWAAARAGVAMPLLAAADAINQAAPLHVLARLETALAARGRRLAGASVLVLGLGYKRNVADLRDSPGPRLMAEIEARGGVAAHFDPLMPVLPPLPEHPGLGARRGIAWSPGTLAGFDAALIAADHDGVDYAALVAHCPLVLDTRNVCARLGLVAENVVGA
ncbi:MAG TPA: nucleotide sugar dehydrogenase, partial [Crenalkalicoccus sp.]|nr:nucleotide sugar dehydrogenase [Crenalkalicoccus sp.]